MITTVTQEYTVNIPVEVARMLGIQPGWKLDWHAIPGTDEIRVRVIPDQAELARRLLGAGRKYSPERNGVAELMAERETEM